MNLAIMSLFSFPEVVTGMGLIDQILEVKIGLLADPNPSLAHWIFITRASVDLAKIINSLIITLLILLIGLTRPANNYVDP